MSFERRPDGKFDYNPPEEIEIKPESVVMAEGELLTLCSMCTKSRMTCENDILREVEIDIEDGEDRTGEVQGYIKQEDGTYEYGGLGFKVVDGVEYGIYEEEDDIPIPFVCEWFEPKKG